MARRRRRLKDSADPPDPGRNVYADSERAAAYSTLEFPGTYYLAFRDIPRLFKSARVGKRALDFGCGTGRSSRFLSQLGLDVIGVDISAEMVEYAKRLDPDGAYRVIADGEFAGLDHFELIFAAFTFDNIPGIAHRQSLLRGLRQLLTPNGRMAMICSTPEIYWHEWASFTTAEFPENRSARSGEQVRIIMKDVDDARPIVDTIWFPGDYDALFRAAGFDVERIECPLARPDERGPWISEPTVAPWVVYVLAPAVPTGDADSG